MCVCVLWPRPAPAQATREAEAAAQRQRLEFEEVRDRLMAKDLNMFEQIKKLRKEVREHGCMCMGGGGERGR